MWITRNIRRDRIATFVVILAHVTTGLRSNLPASCRYERKEMILIGVSGSRILCVGAVVTDGHGRLLVPHSTVAPTPPGADATVLLRFCAVTQVLNCYLLLDTEVGTVELVGVDGAEDRLAVRTLFASQVGDVQLRPRLVGRVSAARGGGHVRLGEVGVGAVDQRDVAATNRVGGVDDPQRLGGDATGLQRNALARDGRRRDTGAQAAVHAIRVVLNLERRVIRESAATQGGAATVVQVHSRGNEAGCVEVRHQALVGDGVVQRRVAVAGAEQDLRLADLLALTQRVQAEHRGGVGAEVTAEDVDGRGASRRGGRVGVQRPYSTDTADEGNRRRGGENLALDGHA